MRKSFIIVMAGLALTACSKQLDTPAVQDSPQEIAFMVGSPETRGATEVTTSNLSTLYVTATTGSSSETAAFTSAQFSKSGSNWTGGKYWPSTDPSYHFYGSNQALTHTSSGATVSPSNANTDIVVGYIANPNFKSVNSFTMEHVFAQVGTVTIKAPAGYTLSGVKVSLRPVTSGTYNLKSASWTSRGSAGSASYIFGTASAGVNINTAGGSSTSSDNDLWLVPGAYELTCSYTIAKGDFSKAYTKTATVTLVQGKNNNIGLNSSGDANIPEPDDISELTFTVTVTPWTDVNLPVSF